MKNHAEAFTLIELLIVVAIIAILAAIAVPNFIEAQTRAKVSRALNDLRQMRTAVESYAVDNVRYPRQSWGCAYDDFYGAPSYEVYGTLVGGPSVTAAGIPSPKGRGGGVTSPIAYITTLPVDPFVQLDYRGTLPIQVYELYRYYEVDSFRQLALAPPCPTGTGSIWATASPGSLERFEQWLGKYVLKSIGPAGIQGVVDDFDATHEENTFTQYDPTNGSLSAGAIFVAHKFFAPKWVNSSEIIWW